VRRILALLLTVAPFVAAAMAALSVRRDFRMVWMALAILAAEGYAARRRRQADAPALPVLTEQERVALDYRITGIPTGPQIMRFYRADLDRRGVLTAAGLAGHSHGAAVRIAGAVVVKQHPETAKGHVFLSLEDETGMSNVIIRPATYRQHKRVLDANAAVVVTGTLQAVDGVISVLAMRLDGLALFVKIAAREWQ